uniref:G_PROTEIN_RECEP_F1_2 domain-containing protein n=1 Tax=Ascaris lumbricoides TaxID=6252 RepID=A0A0M3IFH8_ASCLU
MNFSMLFDEVCETSIRLYYEHSYMKRIFIAEFFIGIIAIISATLLMLAIFFNKTLHFNVRVLFICFCAALLVANIGVLLSSMYYLLSIVYRPPEERCQWLTFTKSDCIALKNVCNLGTAVIVVSALFLSIERIIATLLYRTYEQQQRRWIGLLLGGSQWGLIIPLLLLQKRGNEQVLPYCAAELYNPTLAKNTEYVLIVAEGCALLIFVRGNEQALPYCAAELYSPTLAKNTEYVLIVAEGCALLIFVVLWNHNHKKSVRLCSFYTRLFNASQNVSYALRRKAFVTRVFLLLFLKLNGFCSCSSVNERPYEHALNVRYQVRENVATTKLMVPIMLHNCFFISTLAVLYELFLPVQDYHSKAEDYLRDISRYAIYAELQSSLLPLMTILLMYIMGCFNPHIRHSFAHLLRLDRCFSKNANIINVTSEEHARQLYFDQLQQQWNNFTGDICNQR